MKIQVRERNVQVTKALRAHLERRLGFALGRFAGRIGRVSVHFSEIGSRGSLERRCQIDVKVPPRNVRVEDIDPDLFAAVDHAAARVSRSVARLLEHERACPKGSF